MQKRVETILLVCVIIFGFLNLLTNFDFMPFMALSLGLAFTLSGLTELRNKRVLWGYTLFILSVSLCLLAVIKLFT